MKSNYDKCFDKVIVHEGGYVNDPHDPGGATNLGITIGTLSAYLGHKAKIHEVKSLTKDGVRPIYKRNYWDVVRGDDLPSGIDYAVFDYAVNSGPKRAAVLLQTLVGVATDGVIGPYTLKAVNAQYDKDLITDYCDARLDFLHRLPTWRRYGKGWGRRVEEVRAAALMMYKGENNA